VIITGVVKIGLKYLTQNLKKKSNYLKQILHFFQKNFSKTFCCLRPLNFKWGGGPFSKFQGGSLLKGLYPCQWSISSTFYSHIFQTKSSFLPKSFCQSQNVTREKLGGALLYKNVHLKC